MQRQCKGKGQSQRKKYIMHKEKEANFSSRQWGNDSSRNGGGGAAPQHTRRAMRVGQRGCEGEGAQESHGPQA